jgi:hypothetical protein
MLHPNGCCPRYNSLGCEFVSLSSPESMIVRVTILKKEKEKE